MHDHCSYDYAIVRVVPRVEREEFINIGAIVSCPALDFLEARFEIDAARLTALDPGVDLEALRKHADSMVLMCRGGPSAGTIGTLSQRERFHWLVAPRSTIIQVSAAHSGRCQHPAAVLEHLLDTMVRTRA
jgi:hypothetical protein